MSFDHPIASLFRSHFKQPPDLMFFAPGLVNLMGEHTDYNQGLQVLAAINRGVWAAVKLRSDNQIQVVCNHFPDEVPSWELGALIAQDNEFDWSNILRSLTEQLFSRFAIASGVNFYLHCQLPSSAGFSYVYSLIYAAAAALLNCQNIPFEPNELAHLCWEVKRKYARLDATDAKPRVIANAKPGFVYMHDAFSLELTAVAIHPSWKLLVIDLAEPKQFLDSAIAQRTLQCQTAVKALGVSNLREVSLQYLEQEKNNLDAIIYKRVHHVLTENARCLELTKLIQETQLQELALCFADSQMSLKQDYDVTTERLDSWVEQLKRQFGDSLAVRLNGGGFGGSLVVVANGADISTLPKQIAQVLAQAKPQAVETGGAQIIRVM